MACYQEYDEWEIGLGEQGLENDVLVNNSEFLMCGQIPTFLAEPVSCGANLSKGLGQDEIDITTLVSSVSSVESEDLGFDQEDLYIHDSPVNDSSHSRENFGDPCAVTNSWAETCQNQHSFRPFLRKLTSSKHGNTLETASSDSALCECSAQPVSFESTSQVEIIESVCLAAHCGPHPAAAQTSPPHVREVDGTPRRRKRAAGESSGGYTLKSPRLSQQLEAWETSEDQADTADTASPPRANRPVGSGSWMDSHPTELLRECKFVSKRSGRPCAGGDGGGGTLRLTGHKRGHLAVACSAGHQWVWCRLCCNCPMPTGDVAPAERRGCCHKGHWFERDAFDPGRRNHMRNAHGGA
uniref:Uncharacterized protein n=1 Tax=Cryptomonas curvata TaxID=233186 RepID=A0A7S0N4Y7_9CRYP|mmetsp:Transcript_60705/g.127219  ORF Transcript_60705/g.127219 Transcript_60705/m.127219 type:complete len:354 (+) Transcript_60705:116-1177(+)